MNVDVTPAQPFADGRDASRPDGLKPRLVAAAVHLCGSALLVGGVLLVVFLGWYPSPLDQISGVESMLLLMLCADMTLGPLLTAIVFDRRKKRLRFDLGCIIAVQLLALVYGLYSIEAGRPHFLAFVKDRFEVVSRGDIQAGDWSAAASNPSARVRFWAPHVVAVKPPESGEERQRIMMEAVLGGRDLQHYPAYYQEYASQASEAAKKGIALSELRRLNPDHGAEIDQALADLGRPESAVRYLPVKGPASDGAALIDAADGRLLRLLHLVPWH